MPPRAIGSSVTGSPWCGTVPDVTRVREDGLARRQDYRLKVLQRQCGHDDCRRCENRQQDPQRDTHLLTARNVRRGPVEVDPTNTAITAPSRASTTDMRLPPGAGAVRTTSQHSGHRLRGSTARRLHAIRSARAPQCPATSTLHVNRSRSLPNSPLRAQAQPGRRDHCRGDCECMRRPTLGSGPGRDGRGFIVGRWLWRVRLHRARPTAATLTAARSRMDTGRSTTA
jgi:hypothetical protein